MANEIMRATSGGSAVAMPVSFTGVDPDHWAIFRITAAASINATVVKASSAVVKLIALRNMNAAVRFVKLYNQATTPNPATDVPVATIPLDPNTYRDLYIDGALFSNGLAYVITAAVADTDTTAVAAGDVTGFITFK